MALLNLPVILLQTLAASGPDPNGSSDITVFRPILEMSLSCSLSETMLLHSASTMVSTWYSLTLLTKGPRLKSEFAINFLHFVSQREIMGNYHLTARF